MKLIVGLGNPGSKYNLTRHNIGFMVIDNILKKEKAHSKYDSKFVGEIAIINFDKQKVGLLKPSTFMNLSGDSIYKFAKYYDVQLEDILVIVDDVNLATGKLRLRELGGHGGHNGLRNIIGILKTEQFKRIRIGIGYENNMPLDQFVLGKFAKDDLPLIERAIDLSTQAIYDYLGNTAFIDVMTKYNSQT